MEKKDRENREASSLGEGVMFNFNGHSFDAYEVLGISAGSSPDDIKKAYRARIKEHTSEARAFLDAALHSLEEAKKKSK